MTIRCTTLVPTPIVLPMFSKPRAVFVEAQDALFQSALCYAPGRLISAWLAVIALSAAQLDALALGAFSPALTRSTIMHRSNSSNTPQI